MKLTVFLCHLISNLAEKSKQHQIESFRHHTSKIRFISISGKTIDRFERQNHDSTRL